MSNLLLKLPNSLLTNASSGKFLVVFKILLIKPTQLIQNDILKLLTEGVFIFINYVTK